MGAESAIVLFATTAWQTDNGPVQHKSRCVSLLFCLFRAKVSLLERHSYLLLFCFPCLQNAWTALTKLDFYGRWVVDGSRPRKRSRRKALPPIENEKWERMRTLGLRLPMMTIAPSNLVLNHRNEESSLHPTPCRQSEGRNVRRITKSMCARRLQSSRTKRLRFRTLQYQQR